MQLENVNKEEQENIPKIRTYCISGNLVSLKLMKILIL